MHKHYSSYDPAGFWDRIDSSNGPDSCWPWLCGMDQGYGRLKWRGKKNRAHRVAYELTYGPIPDGLDILHSCDNRPCCNPRHLSPGTQADNNADRDAKGRQAKGDRIGSHLHPEKVARGEQAGNAKLKWAQVREIRARYVPDGISSEQLAKEFGVTRHQICVIVSGKQWRE